MLLSKRKGMQRLMTPVELPQGTLDLLILKTLATGSRHGWGIAERLHQVSSATLDIRQGSLYPALHRLERAGLVKTAWGTSENNRRAKYYELTTRGRKKLDAQVSAWKRLCGAVGSVLDHA
jgi:PadR family transcriptional regulator, regulatory protein PadR